MQDLGVAIPAAVRKELDRIGMTEDQLARLMGQYKSWLSRRLNGQTPITVDELDRIADALGWTAEELCDEAH